jgi:hypothetical protein
VLDTSTATTLALLGSHSHWWCVFSSSARLLAAVVLQDRQPSLPISQPSGRITKVNVARAKLSLSAGSVWATDASVHDRRGQEFEVPDLQLAALLDENDLEIEIRIEIVALLQLFYADSLCRCYLFKFLR